MQKIENILIKLSKRAFKKNEVPVAAILTNKKGKIISKAYNTREKTNLIFEHAEIKCIIKANKRLKNKYLNECNLYVTLEPCEMCKAMIKESRINIVYYMVERNPLKKPYNKTDFQKWNCDSCFMDNYKNILSIFFKKRR